MSVQKVIFRSKGVTYFIDPEEIVYIKAEGSYSTILMKNTDMIKLSKNLKFVLQQFTGVPFLYKVHRSFVLNMNFIYKVLPSEDSDSKKNILLVTGQKVPVAIKNCSGLLLNYKAKVCV